MTRKNITFTFFIVLILMVAIRFLNDETIVIPNLIKPDTGITTSDDYTIDMTSGPSEFVLKLNDDSKSQDQTNLQPTPVNPEEQKDEPVLEVVDIQPVSLDGFKEIYSGVFYKKENSTAIVRVDLKNPTVKFFVNPAVGTKTVCDYLNTYGLQLATNGGGFNMSTGIAGPFAMSDGQVFSSDKKSGITLFVTDSNKVIFSPDGQIPGGAKYAVSGFNRVVQNGTMLDQFHPGHPGYKVGYGYLKRRTTIGISGTWLNIVLFDSPITITDAGQFHLDTFSGTEHVYNMDGGGSTNSCTADYGSLVSVTGRPVATIFGIYAQPTK